jgi:vancomycin resistance protein VanJ
VVSFFPHVNPHATSPSTGRLRPLLRALTVVCSLAYPLALAGVILAFRYVGEQWWVTAVGLYLPRIGFALPFPFVVAALVWWGPRKLLALQVLSALLIVFGLMGLNAGVLRATEGRAGPSFRLVSYNVDAGRFQAGVVEQVRALAPDVVLLQEAYSGFEPYLKAAFEGWHIRGDGEFFIASRFPIGDVLLPPPISYAQGTGSARFVRYTLQTPLGLVDAFSVHFTSPREGLEEVRGMGIREEVSSGRLFAGAARERVEFNAYRRRRQVEGVMRAAASSSNPIVIAGDTNMPGLSWIIGELTGGFRDAFEQEGQGFGYTFPATSPWMRLDRILISDRLRVSEFRVGDSVASDHLCVFAVIADAR